MIDAAGVGNGASFGNAGVLAASSVLPTYTPGMLWSLPAMLSKQHPAVYVRPAHWPQFLLWGGKTAWRSRRSRFDYLCQQLSALASTALEDHLDLCRDVPEAKARIERLNYQFCYFSDQAYQRERATWQQRQRLGVSWEEISGAAVQTREPHFSSEVALLAAFSQHHGSINKPQRYTQALHQHLLAAGVKQLTGQVQSWRSESDCVRVIANGFNVECQQLIVAAGANSAQLLRQQGITLPLQPERGYHIEVPRGDAVVNHATMIVPGKCVVTPMGDTLRVAGVAEFAGFNAPANQRVIESMLYYLTKLLPNFKVKEYSSWFGNRPSLSDSLPIIGPMPADKRVYLAFGHQHIGLTTSAKTGQLVAELLSSGKASIDLSPYALQRFL